MAPTPRETGVHLGGHSKFTFRCHPALQDTDFVQLLTSAREGLFPLKRGGERARIALTEVNLRTEQDPEEILALDDAIRRLEDQDPRTADVVRLRFFAGLSVEETARRWSWNTYRNEYPGNSF